MTYLHNVAIVARHQANAFTQAGEASTFDRTRPLPFAWLVPGVNSYTMLLWVLPFGDLSFRAQVSVPPFFLFSRHAPFGHLPVTMDHLAWEHHQPALMAS
jgi:hypothetical protein